MKKREILNQLQARLEEIQTSNGFLTNLGDSVTYWGDTNQEWLTDGITFRDLSCDIVEVNPYHSHALHIEIEAIAFTDDPLGTGCDLEEDLITALSTQLNWDGKALITELEAESSITKEVETAGKTAISVVIRIIITFRTDKWNLS
jgi:hypothetical protein